MSVQRGPGVWLFLALCLTVAGYFGASRLGLLDRVQARFFPASQPRKVTLSAGDFPAGAAAPVAELASVPLRPTRIGFTPRGSSAALLLATGGALTPDEAKLLSPERPPPGGLLKTAYALDAAAVVYPREEDVRQALALGGEHGGLDMAALSVDRLAQWAVALRDAAPHTVLLLGRSQGQEALAAVGVNELSELRGKRLGTYPQSSSTYFSYWVLARAGLGVNDVRWVDLPATIDAGRALREGRADAVAGLQADVALAARDRGGKLLASTADAPHLVATVLVARGDFAARYPDAVRRVLRGLLDASGAIAKDPTPGARLLGEVAPYLGDPTEAIRSAPPARVHENLAFFGLAGEAPVTYDELYDSAAQLYVKLGKTRAPPKAEDTRDLGALKYVAEARGP